MSRASKEEILEGKLKKAFNLIKEERYTAARFILREFPDNPKARAMLQMMEGKREKRRGFSAISKRTLVITGMVGLMLFTVCGICLTLTLYFSQYSPDELFVMTMAGIGDKDAQLMAVGINYCKISQEMRRDRCQQWPLDIFINYHPIAEACFSPYRENFFLDDETVLAIRRCLRANAAPYTY